MNALWNELDDAVFSAVGQHLTTAIQIYLAVDFFLAYAGDCTPGHAKQQIDESLGKLQDLGLIVLHEHTAPSDPDRSRMIHWNGKVYVGALRRKIQ